jgi:hypothetical protein
LPQWSPRIAGPLEELLAGYRRFLVLERGILPSPAREYAVNVRPFLKGLAGRDGVELARLDGPTVVAFVVATRPSQSRSSAKRTTKGIAVAASVPAPASSAVEFVSVHSDGRRAREAIQSAKGTST